MIVLGMLAKHPSPGTTKTRLARSLGADVAAQFSEAFLLDLIGRLPGLADRFLLCATPDTPAARSWFDEHLPSDAILHYQPEVSFGERMDWFFQTAFEQGADAAILVGSDSPDLPASMIKNAVELLKRRDLVFCPSTDGGYTLIGMNRLRPAVFQSVRFSSRLTLNESLDAAGAAGLTCELLNPWYDIDELPDLCLLRSRIQMDAAVRRLCPRSSDLIRSSWDEIKRLLQELEDRELRG